MLLHFRQRRLDDRAVGPAVRRARKEIGAEILAHQQRVDMRVDERDPLLGPRAVDRVARRQRRAGKGMVDVKADRARFAQRHVAVAHRRDLAERVDRVDLGRVRQRPARGVGHALFMQAMRATQT